MTNKKLALVTCYFQPNYGSQLQAYATQLLFDKMKVENVTICIDGLQSEINKAKYRYFLHAPSKEVCHPDNYVVHIFCYLLYH